MNPKQEILRLLEEKRRRLREDKAAFFKPYPWQVEFVKATSTYREVAAFKGNRVGGTIIGAYMAYAFSTGLYPDWWEGKRFDRPTRGAIITVSYGQQKIGAQRILMGQDHNNWGCGSESEASPIMPKHLILEVKMQKEDSLAINQIMVKHVSGSPSIIYFVSQKQSQDTMMGDDLSWGWPDEFPEYDLMYNQLVTRVETQKGIIFVTATPEHGKTQINVLNRYLSEAEIPRDEKGNPLTWCKFVHKREALHYTEAEVQDAINRCPPMERPFRIEGKPVFGAGIIYSIPEVDILVRRDQLPPFDECRHIIGLDAGIADFGGLVWAMQAERDDIWYVWHLERIRGKKPDAIATIIRHWNRIVGCDIPLSIGRDASNTELTSGTSLRNMLMEEGVNVLSKPAHNDFAGDKDNGLWAGINHLHELMRSGGLKILDSPTMKPLLDEKDLYYVDENGNIPKKRERRFDLLDALRYAIIMGNQASSVNSERERYSKPQFAITDRCQLRRAM